MKNIRALGIILYLVFMTGCVRATTTPADKNFQEVGCYNDKTDHDLEYYAGADPNMEPGMCMQKCAEYPYFGIYNTQHCYCGHKFGKYKKTDMSKCGSKCVGDKNENCGGASTTTVYVNHFYANAWDGTRYLGCMQVPSGSVSTSQILQKADMTIQSCHKFCAGYKFALINNANFCRCAKSLGTKASQFPGYCDKKCAGNENQICGGLTIYGVFDVSNPWPECKSDQIVQKNSLAECQKACAASSTCKIVGYGESSKTCILMKSQCTPPRDIADVTIGLLPSDIASEPPVTIYDFKEAVQCASKGRLPEVNPSKIPSEACQKLAELTPGANYFAWGTTSNMCTLYSSCTLENSQERNKIGGRPGVPEPRPSEEGTVVVQLLDGEQRPVPNMPVTLLDEAGTIVFKSQTDAQGDLTISIEPGTYVLVPEFPDGKGPAPPNDVVEIVVKPGMNDPVKTEFDVDSTVTVEINLVDNDGIALANIPVSIYDQSGNLVATVNTDANGLLVANLDADQYVFKPEYPSDRQPADGNGEFEVTVPNGKFEPMDINVPTVNPTPDVELETITVTLVDDGGEAFTNILVGIYDQDGNLVANAITDGNGVLSIDLPAGEYNLRPVYPPGREPTDGEGSLTISVVPGSETDFVVDTNVPSVDINGGGDEDTTVTVEISLVDNDGIALANIPVSIYDQSGNLVATVNTDANGLLVANLDADQYVFKPEYPSDRQPADGNGEFEVTVPNGKFEPMDIKVPTVNPTPDVELETITVTLVDDGGEAFTNIPVGIYDQDGKLVANATTDGNGVLSIDLPTGEYDLRPVYPPGREPTDGEGSLTISVVPGSETDFVVDTNVPSVDINGGGDEDTTGLLDITVVDKDGKPAENMEIGIYQEDNQLIKTYVTDASGKFTLEIPAGSYVIRPRYPEYMNVPEGEGNHTVKVVAGVNPVYTFNAPVSFVADVDTIDGNNDSSNNWPGQIMGSVYGDQNENQRLDAGEGIEGVEVKLLDETNLVVARVLTKADGSYEFNELVPGRYTIQIDPSSKIPSAGTNPVTKTLNVQSNSTSRFDLRLLGTVAPTSGRLIVLAYVDHNANNVQDPGEQLVVGAPVILTSTDGTEVARAVTDESGQSTMEDVPFGMYNIKLDLSGHPEFGTPYVSGRLQMQTSTLRIAFTIQE